MREDSGERSEERKEAGASAEVPAPPLPSLSSPLTSPPRPQAVILIGLQGSGKSTFCRERLYDTHVRINLDMLRTRRREAAILDACLKTGQALVVDNTNPTIEGRARYIAPARAAGFQVVGFFFDVPIAVCLARNAAREGRGRVPPVGVYGTRKRLQSPTLAEGFDALYRVRPADGGDVLIELDNAAG